MESDVSAQVHVSHASAISADHESLLPSLTCFTWSSLRGSVEGFNNKAETLEEGAAKAQQVLDTLWRMISRFHAIHLASRLGERGREGGQTVRRVQDDLVMSKGRCEQPCIM